MRRMKDEREMYMSRLYLITGFLGAGKTTFLKQFVRFFQANRMHIILNEFGKEGIDGELVRELGIVLDEVNNGSIFCSCRLDKFEEVLQNALALSPEVIIVEASGLSDPTNVKKILNQLDKFSEIEYMGCICLVDAKQFLKVYETATVVKKQLNISNLILLNKVDLVSGEQIEKVRETLHLQRPDLPIYETVHGQFQKEWLEILGDQETDDGEAMFQSTDITLRKYLLHIRDEVNLEKLQNFLKMILEDTFRIKGFVCTGGRTFLINGVGNMLEISDYEKRPDKVNVLVVLSGSGMPVKKSLKTAMEWYPEVADRVE